MSIYNETIQTLAECYHHSASTVTRRYEAGACLQCGAREANNPREMNTLVYYLCDECENLDADENVEQEQENYHYTS